MLLTMAVSEPSSSLKESHPFYFSSSASPGIVYIKMISNNQYAYGTLGQSQDYFVAFVDLCDLLHLFYIHISWRFYWPIIEAYSKTFLTYPYFLIYCVTTFTFKFRDLKQSFQHWIQQFEAYLNINRWEKERF